MVDPLTQPQRSRAAALVTAPSCISVDLLLLAYSFKSSTTMTINYSYYDPFSFFGNMSDAFQSATQSLEDNLTAPDDTNVDTVLTSVVLNSIVCVLLMCAYECLRRLLPAVYSNQKRMDRMAQLQEQTRQSTNNRRRRQRQRKEKQHAKGDGKDNDTSDDASAASVAASESEHSGIKDVSPSDDDDESAVSESSHRSSTTGGNHRYGYKLQHEQEGGDGGVIDYNKVVPLTDDNDDNEVNESTHNNSNKNATNGNGGTRYHHVYLEPLPEGRPLDWIQPVYNVSWAQVRHRAGLDGYLFLRFIRMNVRITAVSSFWFFLVLVPIYAGGKRNGVATGWYHYSIQNLNPPNDPRIWVPCVFLYLFSAFCCFCMKQEYRHYLELRQDFLARGSSHVHPQHHYSLMIENIPAELRSDSALKEYFDKLFPGRVHSASVVLNLPDLEEASQRCLRTCRRLEKSIAYWHATSTRPSHVVGRGRISCLGVDLQPLDCSAIVNTCTDNAGRDEPLMVEDDGRYAERPTRGTRVDSISYYTQELAADSRALFKLQQRKLRIAESGNASITADNWLEQASRNFSVLANKILSESTLENDLLTPDSYDESSYYNSAAAKYQYSTSSPYALYNSEAGPFPATTTTATTTNNPAWTALSSTTKDDGYGSFGPVLRTRRNPSVMGSGTGGSAMGGGATVPAGNDDARPAAVVLEDDGFVAPFSGDYYKSCFRRVLGRLGLDFCVAGIKAINSQLDVALEGVISATMSSTGFVTFLDLSSTTCAASAPLSARSNVLQAHVAPEPREIRWQNAHVSRKTQVRRENMVNALLFVGVIFWSLPLAAIQAFAKSDNLAQVPGLEWINTLPDGKVKSFVMGYLPVVALLTLILILPVIFENVALKIEHRKTFSDVQASMLTRYFYYQLANVYISATAGSLFRSLSAIINHPSSLFHQLGESLPKMAGYFVALLVTKILAGLPMIFLRFGALSRMLLLKTLSNEKKLTQRELDAVYRLENVQYGWEFPTQLLVVVIVFTYAVLCPLLLPVGCCYFMGALLVYKKQVLYVYSPVYESGGAMFPIAVQRSLVGLVCGQLTFIGYLMTKSCHYEPIFLFPLPVLTIYCMSYFSKTYAEPGNRLSLERAREHDRMTALFESKNYDGKERASTTAASGGGDADAGTAMSSLRDAGVESRRRHFDKSAYRQPVLTELAAEPWTYRRGVDDPETIDVRNQLRQVNRYSSMQLRQSSIAQTSFSSQSRHDLLSP